jgi:hypothetical protein
MIHKVFFYQRSFKHHTRKVFFYQRARDDKLQGKKEIHDQSADYKG